MKALVRIIGWFAAYVAVIRILWTVGVNPILSILVASTIWILPRRESRGAFRVDAINRWTESVNDVSRFRAELTIELARIELGLVDDQGRMCELRRGVRDLERGLESLRHEIQRTGIEPKPEPKRYDVQRAIDMLQADREIERELQG